MNTNNSIIANHEEIVKLPSRQLYTDILQTTKVQITVYCSLIKLSKLSSHTVTSCYQNVQGQGLIKSQRQGQYHSFRAKKRFIDHVL